MRSVTQERHRLLMPIVLWVALIGCNFFWSFNPTLAKILIQHLGPLWTCWVRYSGALLAYFTFLFIKSYLFKKKYQSRSELFLKPKSFSDAFDLCILGCATFFLSPLSQMIGLESSTATNNAILVALEPLFTALFGWIFLKDRLNRLHLFSFILAFVGFSLLSRLVTQASWTLVSVSFSKGDLGLVMATACEAVYSVFGRRLMRNHRGPAIFGTALLIGVFLLTCVAWISSGGLPRLGQLNGKIIFAAIWIGPIGTTLTYLFWLFVLERGVSIGAMALTLFVQPVVGALFGFFVLNEQLTFLQFFGATLILSAVVIPESSLFRKPREVLTRAC